MNSALWKVIIELQVVCIVKEHDFWIDNCRLVIQNGGLCVCVCVHACQYAQNAYFACDKINSGYGVNMDFNFNWCLTRQL